MNNLNLINGEWVKAANGAMGKSFDPATGKSIGVFASAAKADAQAAISAAVGAFENPQWSQSPRLRQMVLLRWADRLEQRSEELANLMTRENGKIIAHSRGEIGSAISEIRYYAGLARHITGNMFETEPGVYSNMLREPAGVAAIIVPWNAPVALLIRSLAPALAAGCTTVIKPAPQTALLSCEVIRELHADHALPAGVVNFLAETGHEVAEELVASPDVAVISFTGSNITGQRIMAAAAPSMKKLSLELGGKSCAIVLPDADVGHVAPLLTSAAIIISGQQCTAARRVLVHESRYAEMKQALKNSFENVVVGSGLVSGVHMGPLIDAQALSSVGAKIEQALDTCDEVIVRGGRPGNTQTEGFYLHPTLVAHDDTSAFFCQEEIFGPFVVLERFSSECEAVRMANHSEYGLSASIWGKDGAQALRLARALRNGTVWINEHNKLFAEAETGGYKRSGLGRLHGYDALADFTEVKHIYQSTGVVGD